MKIPRFDGAHILVVGDAMLDRYWHGDTHRISAEAPIPIVDVNEVEDRPGAAANVALNVATLGARASLVAAVGQDEPAGILKGKLEAANIFCDLVELENARTTTKLRIVSQSQQIFRADFEDIVDVPGEKVVAHMSSSLKQADSVLLSDYDKGLLADPQSIIKAASDLGKPVLVDPKYKPLTDYRGATSIRIINALFLKFHK